MIIALGIPPRGLGYYPHPHFICGCGALFFLPGSTSEPLSCPSCGTRPFHVDNKSVANKTVVDAAIQGYIRRLQGTVKKSPASKGKNKRKRDRRRRRNR